MCAFLRAAVLPGGDLEANRTRSHVLASHRKAMRYTSKLGAVAVFFFVADVNRSSKREHNKIDPAPPKARPRPMAAWAKG